jgi:hypothetical protein
VKSYRQAADVGLNLLTKFGDQALRGFGEKLGERK